MGGALLEAAARGDAGRVASLIRAGAPVDARDENGISALQRAAADGHVDVVRVLLEHGADPNTQDRVHGNTATHEAAWKGYSRCVALLARCGALRARNAAGFAPLHLATQNGHNQTTRELLLAGAPPDLQNNYGDTSLHTAARYGHAGVTRILISAQCRVSEQNKNGDTALHIAAAMGRRKLTRILLEAGCDKSLRNHQGETARDIATRKGLEEIIAILNTPVAKQKKKEKRDKSRDRTIDEPDDGKKRDKSKDKKKKNVHFETPPQVQWSPYGCHYYPDPKYFPKPKLSSLPTEPLKKGEQYYLDLAGNIKKGPIGAGYTCYCAPFFKHMEEKLNEDKKDLKRHIDRAHERLDQKVTDLEMKTQGQISELTRFVAAERALCKERHKHLEQWLTRGVVFRQSERVRKLDFSPKGSVDIAPIKRTRSLELLDANGEDWHMNERLRRYNDHEECQNCDSKEVYRATSKSTEGLDTKPPPSPRRIMKCSKSSDQLDAGPSRCARPLSYSNCSQASSENVTSEIHVHSNKASISHSPVHEVIIHNERYASPPNPPTLPSSSSWHSEREGNIGPVHNGDHVHNVPSWKSQVLQKTAEDIRKKSEGASDASDGASRNSKSLDISQDGYVKLHKQPNSREESVVVREPRKTVQELVAQVEHQQRCKSPERVIIQRVPENPPTQTSPLKVPQQPQRPAPVLKDKPQKQKRFSLHNLIPFPTRKNFQTPPKENGNNSESSDEEDNPIRTTNQPGPMRNTNLLQTLPLPNFETMSTKSQSPAPQVQPYPHDIRMIPKDAYFHEIPNKHVHINPNHQMPYREMETGLPIPQYPCQNQYEYNEAALPQPQIQARNRNPIFHHQTGVFNAMMQDHIIREIERIPHCYSDHLDQNTEVEIANQNEHFRYDNRPPMYPNRQMPAHSMRKGPDHNFLHSRLQSLAINTHLSETQSQADRESHNDSGYSTKVYGSSQGPSPSLSGHVEDNLSGRVNVLPNKEGFGASSLV
ncbi:uncharacterized protein LOC121735648 [Aricia agestis]|uniref:uncharacterized protein LOC121735648 n=1 Tax=Aricia agestis TaxID=91739 RepID=UPI001C202480|nr:uncharacterized protein LOC121735648 [Aricia agestis]XP_041982481.1 uncharacterized protein LOC121735648 [Aricia agestis]XP_041982482.1 uncharacterized protein LOC121735648 [Aricia agestis]